MDILINIVLPLSLAIIMLSLGVGLTLGDFSRIARHPKSFAIGAASQILLVPLCGWLIVILFGLSGEIAVGVMLISFCPGGVTSNMISKLANGDVALSVALTAVISLLSILTVPIVATWAVLRFLGDAAPDVSVASLAIAMFLITTLPVILGMTLRHLSPALAERIKPGLSTLATGLFVVMILVALAGNWSLFITNFTTLGPALITLNAALLCGGLALALISKLDWQACKTISIETGIQNASLGITLAAIISGQNEGFSTMALPSAVYAITMYLVTLPFVAWLRSR